MKWDHVAVRFNLYFSIKQYVHTNSLLHQLCINSRVDPVALYECVLQMQMS